MRLQWNNYPTEYHFTALNRQYQAMCEFVERYDDLDDVTVIERFSLDIVRGDGQCEYVFNASYDSYYDRKANLLGIFDEVMDVYHKALLNPNDPFKTFNYNEFDNAWESMSHCFDFKKEDTLTETLENLQMAAMMILSLVDHLENPIRRKKVL